ncbi:MAG: hemerythrin family protein [Rhodospirillaceae bacterium]
MPTLSRASFKSVFDSHLMDICENLRRLGGDQACIVGIQAHDQQHEQIVERYNEFIVCLRDPNRLDERPEKFQRLVSYIIVHFTAENTLMHLLGYPEYEEHKKQHASFIDRINVFIADIKDGRSSIDELVLYIGHWLLGHVLLADKDFGDFEASLTELPIH